MVDLSIAMLVYQRVSPVQKRHDINGKKTPPGADSYTLNFSRPAQAMPRCGDAGENSLRELLRKSFKNGVMHMYIIYIDMKININTYIYININKSINVYI